MAEFYHLHDGGLAAERAEGRRYLQRRTGRWRMVPSASDLLVFRRDEPGAPARGIRAVLSGDLEGFPVVDLLGYLAQARWTGSVTVVGGAQERRLVLQQGRLVAATSTFPGHRIGQVLKALGHLSEEDLATALATPRPDGTRLDQVLVADGWVSREEIRAASERRVQEIFFDVLTLDRGLFFLFNDPVEDPTGVELDLNFLLMEGLRRLDETARHREVAPDPGLWLSPAGEVPPDDRDQRRVWDAIGTGLQMGELTDRVAMFPYDLHLALAGLVEDGRIQVGEAPPASDPAEALHAALSDRVERLLVDVFESVPEMARTELAEAMEQFLLEDEAGEVLGPLAVDATGRMPPGALSQRLTVVDGAGQEALESLTLFTLLQAGRHLGRDAHQRLTRQARAALRPPRTPDPADRLDARTVAEPSPPPGIVPPEPDPFAGAVGGEPPDPYATPTASDEVDPFGEADAPDPFETPAGDTMPPEGEDGGGDRGEDPFGVPDTNDEDPFGDASGSAHTAATDPTEEGDEGAAAPPTLPDAADFEGLLDDAFGGEAPAPATRTPWQWPQARPTWTPDEATKGQVEVTSDPPGASVYLDGTRQGQTPTSFPQPPGTGAHKLELRLHGRRVWSRTVMLGGADTARFHAEISSDESRAAP